MPGATFAYFLAYLLFSAFTKYLSGTYNSYLLALASTFACVVVCCGGFAGEAFVAFLHKRPPILLRTLARILERDVVVAAACSAIVLIASTIAYGTAAVSLLLPLLLMKGGVLLWGPTVDWLRGTDVPLRARVVLALAAAAIVAALWQKVSLAHLGVGVALICAAAYVVAYFPKIAVMQRHRGDVDADYVPFLLAEMTLTLALALPGALGIALVHYVGLQKGVGGAAAPLQALSALWRDLSALLRVPGLYALAAGSEGAGLFGGLLFLAPVGATLSVPLNRCTSLLAGVVATATLWVLKGGTLLEWASRNGYEVVGAAAMLVALAVGLSGRRAGADKAGRGEPVGLVAAAVPA